MHGIGRRLRRSMEATLAEHGLTNPDWQVLTSLRLDPAHRSSPGELAGELELSSGAMTSRLDRLEEAGLVRRLPDPDDRRGVVVELTDAGREAWDTAASVQGRQEAFIASALTKSEQQELNDLLAQADARVRGAGTRRRSGSRLAPSARRCAGPARPVRAPSAWKGSRSRRALDAVGDVLGEAPGRA